MKPRSQSFFSNVVMNWDDVERRRNFEVLEKMAERGKTWSDAETAKLIEAWSERTIQSHITLEKKEWLLGFMHSILLCLVALDRCRRQTNSARTTTFS